MRSIFAPFFILLNIFIFITVGDMYDYGIFGDTELGGSIMEDSSDIFASDDISSDMISMDPSEGDENTQYLISSQNDCRSDLGEMPQRGKTRREDMCHDNQDADHTMNEQPFVLPATLLDAATVKPEKYCPLERFNEGSQYLVCSSGFSMDILSYGLIYQALLNGELCRYNFACVAPVIVILETLFVMRER